MGKQKPSFCYTPLKTPEEKKQLVLVFEDSFYLFKHLDVQLSFKEAFLKREWAIL